MKKNRSVLFFVMALGIALSVYGESLVGLDTLTISGRVGVPRGEEGSFLHFNGNMPVTSEPQGGVGVVTDGQLNFFIGTPTALVPIERAVAEAVRGWGSISINNPAALGARLVLRTPKHRSEIRHLWSGGAAFSRWQGGIYYIYVDRDVTISARRRIENIGGGTWEWIVDHRAFDITLQRGWNALLRDSNNWGDDNPQGFMVYRLSLATAADVVIEDHWWGLSRALVLFNHDTHRGFLQEIGSLDYTGE